MKLDAFLLKIAACLGFLAISLGAFGAHGMQEKWNALPEKQESIRRADVWRTAAQYHLAHSVALLALALTGLSGRFRWTARCWIAGVLIFSGSLYLNSFTGIKMFGAITPFGGLLLLGGWFALALDPGKKAD